MSQLSSHWRMAYVCFRKAVWVTFQIMSETIKAWLYINSSKNTSRLAEQRMLYKLMEKDNE